MNKKKAGKNKRKTPTKRAKGKGRGPSKPYPSIPFEDALSFAKAIQKEGGGNRVRRLTLFDQLKKSPDSSASRELITNSGKYGLIKGSYIAEYIELTKNGNTASNPDISPKDQLKARFESAIEKIPIFKEIYEVHKNKKLPSTPVMEDFVKEKGIKETASKECVETLIVNAKYLGILKTISGAERIVPIEQALEELPPDQLNKPSVSMLLTTEKKEPSTGQTEDLEPNWENICFYISPIGEDDSEQRKHADLFLESIVEPSIEEFNLKVVRADNIGKAGMITAQILEYIIRSKLVIADLSYHNPNVFYELSLRHVCRLPTVQIIRKSDNIPFDLEQFRTIKIDTTDIFTMVPNLQSYKAEIGSQVRTALKNPDSVDNPISIFYPKMELSFD